jgi:predicted metal-dependent phosphoesterase TrpH
MPLRRPLVLVVPLVGVLLALPASSEPVPLEGSWLTGDTHVHTDHSSDGSGPRQALDQRGPGSTSVATQIRAAERRGLDFLPITDHRTYDQHWHPEWTSSQLVLVPGEEANGSPHANVLGAVDQTVDGAEPPGAPGFRHVQQSIWDVHAQDAAWQTNHPDDGEVGDDGRPNANASAVGVDTVEVLNSDSPEAKLDYVEDRWNAGYRFGVVGASDSHFSELDAVQGPGLPATRLLAGGRSERSGIT